jgi:hypothetical protein
MISRAVPNIKSDRPAETREFFVDLLGFEVAMDLGWVGRNRQKADFGPALDQPLASTDFQRRAW